MSRLKQFQEKQKKLSRFQALKSIFTSAAMTVAVVIVAAVAIPVSPSGSIDSVEAFTNVVTYTVNITDEDNAIMMDTLCVRLENQVEVYENSLNLGVNSGLFDNLNPETEYTLRIMANKGYGLEVLDRVTLKTAERTGGAITGINLLSEEDAWTIDYSIGYFISDPFDEYKSVQLRYATKFDSEPDYQFYNSLSLDELGRETFIQNIYNENQQINIILEAINQNDEIVELDNVTLHTPFKFYASMGIEHVTNRSVSVYVWPEPVSGVEIEYELVLMRLGYVIDTRKIVPMSHEDEWQMEPQSSEITFDRLVPETDYTIMLIARYSDPYTLAEVEKTVASEEFTTTPDFDYDIQVVEETDHYRVTLTITPQDAIYDYAYYNTFIYVDGFYQYYYYQSFTFETIDDTLYVSFEIYKPAAEDYRIMIGITDTESYIHFVIVYTIETIQEG